MFAILESLGFGETVVLVLIGLLLYGRNLPEAGRKLGRAWTQVRRGLQDFKQQMDRDGDLREAKRTLQDTMQEVKRVTEVPRALVDPRRVFRDLADEAMRAPAEDPGAPAANAGTPAAAANGAAEPRPSAEPRPPAVGHDVAEAADGAGDEVEPPRGARPPLTSSG